MILMTTITTDQPPEPPPEPRAGTINSFDEAGVTNYIKDKPVLNWFRKIVQQYEVPWDKQAKLAAVLLDEAVELNNGKLTLPFLKFGEQIKLEAVQHQLQRELKNCEKGLVILFRSGRVVAGLLKQYPQASWRSITVSVD
jgi:hypothetical protein